MVQGGALLGAGLRAAAQYASMGLQKGAEFATARLAPAESPVKVSPETLKNLERARGMAAAAAGFTGRVATGGSWGFDWLASAVYYPIVFGMDSPWPTVNPWGIVLAHWGAVPCQL